MIRIPPPRAWDPAAWVLVAANLAPVGGVLALGWEAGPLLWLYWLENLILGGFTVLRITTAPGGATKALLAPFFAVHYGLFCFVHGVFVGVIAARGDPPPFPGLEGWRTAWEQPGGQWMLLALLASHAYAFLGPWLAGGERGRTSALAEMMRPYGRVVVMHLTVMIGGAALVFSGAPAIAVAGLAAVKTAADLAGHFAARRAASHAVR